MPDLRIVPASLDDPEMRALMAEQEVEIMLRYGSDEASPPAPAGSLALIAYLDEDPVGCVAVAPLNDDAGEVKRLYVAPRARGRRVSRRLMAAIERVAWEHGYRRLRLETGLQQPEAVRLYETSGWAVIENYGHYRHYPNTISMQKRLVGEADGS